MIKLPCENVAAIYGDGFEDHLSTGGATDARDTLGSLSDFTRHRLVFRVVGSQESFDAGIGAGSNDQAMSGACRVRSTIFTGSVYLLVQEAGEVSREIQTCKDDTECPSWAGMIRG